MNPVAILGSSELPEGGTVPVGEEEVLLVRAQGQVYALQAYCPHHGAPLTEGVLSGTRLDVQTRRVELAGVRCSATTRRCARWGTPGGW